MTYTQWRQFTLDWKVSKGVRYILLMLNIWQVSFVWSRFLGKLICFQNQIFHWSAAPVSYQIWHYVNEDAVSINYSLFHSRKSYFHTKEPKLVMLARHFECLESLNAPFCFTKENDSRLTQVKVQTSFVSGSAQHCTVLLLSNLATPKWLTTNCSEKILPNVACFEPFRTKSFQTAGRVERDEMCLMMQVFIIDACLKFIHFEPHTTQQKNPCKNCGQKPVVSSRKIIGFLKVMFQASSLHLKSFHMMESDGSWKLTTFEKRWTSIFTAKGFLRAKQEASLVCISPSLRLLSTHSTLLMCSNGEYISGVFVCDENNGCYKANYNSEGLWNCSQGCAHKDDTLECHCSPLFYKTRNMRCQSFVESVSSANEITLNSFTGETNRGQPSVDCIMTDIKCDPSHLVQFNVYKLSEICIYKLDHSGFIIPCKAGSHLQDCKLFVCPLHLKCPNFYCVPWGHKCDGKWDCPSGFEESPDCYANRECSSMYRCRNSTVCTHLNDICDAYSDCPFNDDEIQCSLKYVICPRGCHCLNYALWCENTTFQEHTTLLYISYYITSSKITVPSLTAIVQNEFSKFIKASSNNFTDICSHSFVGQNIHTFDVSDNCVAKIQRGCFEGLNNIYFITVKSNHIRHLHPFSILNISSSLSLDLSTNNLTSLSKFSIFNVHCIISLLLRNNPIVAVDVQSIQSQFIYLVQADHYTVCCIQIAQKCRAHLTGSCKELLPTNVLKAFYISVAMSIITLNCISFLGNIWNLSMKKNFNNKSGKPKRFAWPYDYIVSSLYITDVLYGMYLLIIWFTDRSCNSYFVVMAASWGKSTLCTAAIFTVTLFSILAPLLSAYLSLSRFVVIWYPFNATFKSIKFTYQSLLVLFFSAVTVSVLWVTLFKKICEISTRLCVPFVQSQFPCPHIIHSITLAVFAFQTLVIVFMAILHGIIFVTLQASKNAARTFVVFVQVMSLSMSTIVCWIPSNIIFSTSLFLEKPSTELLTWTTGAILPLNSIINPVIVAAFLLRQGRKPRSSNVQNQAGIMTKINWCIFWLFSLLCDNLMCISSKIWPQSWLFRKFLLWKSWLGTKELQQVAWCLRSKYRLFCDHTSEIELSTTNTHMDTHAHMHMYIFLCTETHTHTFLAHECYIFPKVFVVQVEMLLSITLLPDTKTPGLLLVWWVLCQQLVWWI